MSRCVQCSQFVLSWRYASHLLRVLVKKMKKKLFSTVLVRFAPKIFWPVIGYRFNASLLVRLTSSSGPECVRHCLNHPCCRAVNYRRTEACSNLEPENCEILHPLAMDNLDYFEKSKFYDYYVLLEPYRVSTPLVS